MSKLDALIQTINKEYKEEVFSKGLAPINIEKIPFSSPRANYMTYGGLPRGRLVEFAGEEGSGKTTTALDIAANAQKVFKQEYEEAVSKLEAIDEKYRSVAQKNRLSELKTNGPQKVLYLDCENTLDEEWAELLGVNLGEVYILKPQSQAAEELFQNVLDAIDTNEVGLVVIDSLGVMLSQAAYDKTMEEKTYGGIAMALTLFSKKAVMLCQRTNCTLIGINQVREDMSGYGIVVTTGGRAWKHNCSARILFQKGSFIDSAGREIPRKSDSPAGNLVTMNIIKTKVCKPDRRVGFYTLNYTEGVDSVMDVIDLAIKYNLIVQAGAWFTICDGDGAIMETDDGPLKFQGKPALITYLRNNSDKSELLMQYLTEKITLDEQ